MSASAVQNVEARYLEAFEALEKSSKASWMTPEREEAIKRFAGAGLPHRRVEAWKYTDLRARLAAQPSPVRALEQGKFSGRAPETVFAPLRPVRFVFVDGALVVSASDMAALPSGVEIVALTDSADALPDWVKARFASLSKARKDAVVDLNTGLMQSGVALRIGAGVTPDSPVEFHFLSQDAGASHFIRNMIVLEDKASLVLIEHHHGSEGSAQSFNNITGEIFISSGAQLTHVKFGDQAKETIHVASDIVRLEREAIYDSAVFCRGSGLMREQLFADIAGEGGQVSRHAITLTRASQHHDHSAVIDHHAPRGTSRFVVKSILKEKGHAVAQGHTIVHPGAAGTDGRQLIRGLLLSPETEMDMKPQLEIYADDVKCAHGASAGALDESAMFYMRTRGISEAQARALLVRAFVEEVVEAFALSTPQGSDLRAGTKVIVENWVSQWLEEERS